MLEDINDDATEFQSAPLTRGETEVVGDRARHEYISIRSPHTRGDRTETDLSIRNRHFNPLPSHEGRPSS